MALRWSIGPLRSAPATAIVETMPAPKIALPDFRATADSDTDPRWLQPALLVMSILLLLVVSVGAFVLVSTLGDLADTIDRQQRPPATVTLVESA